MSSVSALHAVPGRQKSLVAGPFGKPEMRGCSAYRQVLPKGMSTVSKIRSRAGRSGVVAVSASAPTSQMLVRCLPAPDPHSRGCMSSPSLSLLLPVTWLSRAGSPLRGYHQTLALPESDTLPTSAALTTHSTDLRAAAPPGEALAGSGTQLHDATASVPQRHLGAGAHPHLRVCPRLAAHSGRGDPVPHGHSRGHPDRSQCPHHGKP